MNHFTGGPCLQSHQCATQYFLCNVNHFIKTVTNLHPIDTGLFYFPFTATTRMYLCFYHRKRTSELSLDLAISFFSFMNCTAGNTFLYRHIVFFQKFFSLEFVKIHIGKISAKITKADDSFKDETHPPSLLRQSRYAKAS